MSIAASTRIVSRIECRPAVTKETPKPDLEDPTAVTFRVEAPDGTTTDQTWPSGDVAHLSEGTFSAQFVANVPGKWKWQWLTTGAVEVAKVPNEITVAASLTPPA